MATVLEPYTCRAARALLNWSASKLVREAGIMRRELFDVERGRGVDAHVYDRLRRTFESVGIVIVRQDEREVGVRFEDPSKVTATALGWPLDRDVAASDV